MLLPKNKCLEIVNLNKKALKNREFLEFRWCWSAIALEKYNTRFRADTSDRSHLQKCSPNVVCYFWRSCLTSYSCKSRFFSTFTLLISLTFTVPILYSTQTIAKCSIVSLPREGYILKRGPNSSKLHSCTELRIDTTQNILCESRKPHWHYPKISK